MKSLKSKIILIALVFSAVFLVACENTDLKNTSIFGEPKETEEVEAPTVDADGQIQRILDLIEEDNPEALLEWVHPNSLEKYGRKEIVDRNNSIHESIGLLNIELKNFKSLDVSQDKNIISYQGDMVYETQYGLIEKPNTFNFIYHPKAARWQLDWTPSVILPGLHDQGLVQIMPIPASRGNIYDRTGKPLATKSYINRVGIVPSGLREEDIPAIEQAFGLYEGFIQEQLSLGWVTDDTFVPIKTLVEMTDAHKAAVNDYYLTVQQISTRSYPYENALAHLIGYVGKPTAEDLEKEGNEDLTGEDFIGKNGLEAIYDTRLRGKPGFKIIVTGAYQQVLLEQEAQNGDDLYLTIDADLQKHIYDQNANKNGTFTALDPRNGDILALVSVPSYNPHDFILGISQSDFDALLNDPKLPLYNKFANALTPGSTEKLLTAIAGFNAGTMSDTTTYNIQGKGWIYDASWGNHQVIRSTVVNGDIDFYSAMYNSDNIYFARVALDMGLTAFNEQMANLQFGQAIAADYPFGLAQVSNTGLVENTILLADAGYGQGEVLISPVHLASIYGAIAQNGVWYRPRLLLETEDQVITQNIADARDVASIDKSLRLVISKTYTSLMREYILLAGKSGTAEVGYDQTNNMVKQNSWFISYDQNQRNLVLAATIFDTHLLTFSEAINATGETFDRIYANGPYSPPAVDVPAYITNSTP